MGTIEISWGWKRTANLSPPWLCKRCQESPEFWVSVSVVKFQPLEKVEKQFLFFQGCSPVEHSGIILKEPAMVIDIEEIFPHPWTGLLALNVVAPLRKVFCGEPLSYQ